MDDTRLDADFIHWMIETKNESLMRYWADEIVNFVAAADRAPLWERLAMWHEPTWFGVTAAVIGIAFLTAGLVKKFSLGRWPLLSAIPFLGAAGYFIGMPTQDWTRLVYRIDGGTLAEHSGLRVLSHCIVMTCIAFILLMVHLTAAFNRRDKHAIDRFYVSSYSGALSTVDTPIRGACYGLLKNYFKFDY